MAKGMLTVHLGGIEYRYRITGKPLKMVEEVCEKTYRCDECGEDHTYSYITERPAKWYKKENIVKHRLPGRDVFIPLYDSA